jgi:hypothetical protein
MGLDNVVGLIRNLMHLSANVGDVGEDGAVPSLWSQLPKIIVVGGQVRVLWHCCDNQFRLGGHVDHMAGSYLTHPAGPVSKV